MKKLLSVLLLIGFIGTSVLLGQKEASVFDFGKMWTFEHPPKEYFKEAYGFEPSDEWFERVRMSSLRFATWCSASFVSPDGLIMTNHHCSRNVVTALQAEGENFDKQGFYAKTLSDERKADGLFVEQLVKVVDITAEVKGKTMETPDDELAAASQIALQEIQTKYQAMSGWENLRLQTVTYYSGGKYSLYGYKRFDDIRLVLIPELDLGFYGGDPDNFTYPRYNLDVTFWRAYDENGEPLNTSAHYLPFKEAGAVDGEVTFVVGNPGSTERYRTVDQLKWDRDYRYSMQLKFMKNRQAIMEADYTEMIQDPSKEFEAQELLNQIANIANGTKAIGGIVEGMNNPELFNRKVAMEKSIKKASPGITYWDDLKMVYKELEPHTWPLMHLGPSNLRGNALLVMHELHNYENLIADDAEDGVLTESREKILGMGENLDTPEERNLFKLLLTEISEDIYKRDNTMTKLLGSKSIDAFVDQVIDKTRFTSRKKGEKCLKKTDKVKKDDDPLLRASRMLIPKYIEAGAAFQTSSPKRRLLEKKIANQVFNVHGTSLPPDATFTLRISDGVVKGYEYNGTIAPVNTTYYGMYDRHYSHGEVFPWSLPERWLNPPSELLKAPLNFVSTNDIIGGNSGSPMINASGEVVGLIFDGNIESLPGNFIFDDELNRTVSVHAGGIMAAIRYIYNANRLVEEMVGK